MRVTSAILGVLGAMVCGACGLWASPPYAIRHLNELVLLDLGRHQELSFDLYYPESPGAYPVILFSHAEGGTPAQLQALGKAWAESGFVCVFPHHKDMTDVQAEPAWVQSAFPDFGSSNLQHLSGAARQQDLVFLMDSLDQLQENILPDGVRVLADRIGLGGHAFGAFAPLRMAGVRVAREDLSGDSTAGADPRPRAFLFISPPGNCKRLALHEDSWSGLTRPMLVITGGQDLGPKGERGNWRRAAYDLSPPGDKFLLWFENGLTRSFIHPPPEEVRNRHFPLPKAFAQVDGREQHRIYKAARDATLLFWRAYLADDRASQVLLGAGELPLAPQSPHDLLAR